MPRDRERTKYRDRRSSSYSSESSIEDKKSKSKYRRRSRSKGRVENGTHRKKRSTSKIKRRSYSRSLSKERYESRSRRRSTSRSRSKRSKYSRSMSRSKSRDHKHRKHKRHSSSRSRSTSLDIELQIQNSSVDDTEKKIQKAIKAAEAAGLTMTKLPTYEFKQVEIKEDMPTMQDRNLLDELNSDSFVQKAFTSSRNNKHSILIDLNAQTVKLPETTRTPKKDDSILKFDEIPNQENLKEMWIKKLYQYRKKMLKGEIM